MSNLIEMQGKLLEMFKYFHEFCTCNDIKYYSLGGTTLGAVRHQGFIPWDDDVDVGLPREDYEKLIKMFPNNNNKYIIESGYSKHRDFCYPYAKIYDTTTTLIENIRNPIKRGIYIDVFPIDGVGNTKEEVVRTYDHINRKNILKNYRITKINNSMKWYYKALFWLIQHLPKSIADEKKLCLDINNLCKKKSYDRCKMVGNLAGGIYGMKEIMPKKLLGKPTLHKFENIKIYIPEDFERYLTHLYGDWRKLPPEEKQIPHHDYVLDLNHSYLE